MIILGRHTNHPATPIDCYSGVNVTIGSFCSIGSGLKILSGKHPCIDYPKVVSQYPFHEHQDWKIEEYPESKMGGEVFIGNDVWIATDVSILEGVVIGDGAIIAAKTVVTKNVPSYAFVAGNPGEIKRYRFPVMKRRKLESIAWWTWEDEKIQEAMPSMKDIDVFIKKFGAC